MADTDDFTPNMTDLTVKELGRDGGLTMVLEEGLVSMAGIDKDERVDGDDGWRAGELSGDHTSSIPTQQGANNNGIWTRRKRERRRKTNTR